jgi:hypothetical protein
VVSKDVICRWIKHEERAEDVIVRNLAGLLKRWIMLRRHSGQDKIASERKADGPGNVMVHMYLGVFEVFLSEAVYNAAFNQSSR